MLKISYEANERRLKSIFEGVGSLKVITLFVFKMVKVLQLVQIIILQSPGYTSTALNDYFKEYFTRLVGAVLPSYLTVCIRS